jgi:site-specific DNA recombinase
VSTVDKNFRCAIYTRKSSEEGLDQAFNSLDAQRDACEAYIKSQSHEGWADIGARYDDGGFSGGNIDRPGLQNLLSDVKAGKIDIIVVYKIDRLTRSLADFAKIVETLDRHSASFVAVTQQFNTTSSMGRLTLNVLLSFAQFEREVSGERIRDKIAASKRRGMWMGGHPPLGYDAEGRTLRVNEAEAELVRSIFDEYLSCKTVPNLRVRLRRLGIKSKKWKATTGAEHGGAEYSRGALYYLLRNQIYIGRITHKKDAYPGNHPAIISDELWAKVQSQLAENRSSRKRKSNIGTRNPLAGLLYDDCGNLMSPSFTQRPKGRRYRYYISQATLQSNGAAAGSLARISAPLIEGLVARRTKHLLVQDDYWNTNPKPNAASLRDLIERVVVGREKVEIYLRDHRPAIVTAGMIVKAGRASTFTEFGSAAVRTYGGPATSLVKALCRAWNWIERFEKGEVSSYYELGRLEGLSPPYVRSTMRLAFLAPDLVEAILRGDRVIGGGITAFFQRELPMSWEEQRKLFYEVSASRGQSDLQRRTVVGKSSLPT